MHELQCKERSQWYVADTISLDRLDGNQKEITKKSFKTKKEAEESIFFKIDGKKGVKRYETVVYWCDP